MGEETSKHEVFLKKIQLWIAVLAGATTLIVGAYNVKKIFFSAQASPGDLLLTAQTWQGSPLQGVRIEVYDSQNALIGSSKTSAAGQLTKQRLEAGNYLVKAQKDGFEPQVLPVRVISKKTTEVDLVLTAAGAKPEAVNPIKSALEETGAAFIRNFGSKVVKTEATKQS
jgi:hypothetical protein